VNFLRQRRDSLHDCVRFAQVDVRSFVAANPAFLDTILANCTIYISLGNPEAAVSALRDRFPSQSEPK
jgi:predicted glycoside hydrolase/deacetylase ChbG (UPF0249 family)